MGSFYGQGERPSFSAQMMSMLGVPAGMGGTNAKPGGDSATVNPDCPDGQHLDPRTRECVDDDVDPGGDDGEVPPDNSACKEDCKRVYRNAMGREPFNASKNWADLQNCLSACDGGTGTNCPPGQLWDKDLGKCVPQSPNCPPGHLWNEETKKCRPVCPPGQRWTGTGCVDDVVKPKPDPCPAGQVWDPETKKCITKPTPGNCPEGITPGAAFGACSPCGKKYMLVSASCLPGYVPVPKPEGTQCECVEWCKAVGYGNDCVTKTGPGTQPALGEFAFPPEIQELYRMLMGRGKEYAERRPGYSGPAMDLMFGKGADNLRAGGVAQDASMRSILSGQGLSGTGAGNAIMGQAAMQREAGIGNLIRDLALGNEEQTRADRQNYTNAATNLFGTGMGYNTGLEAINSSRRGEGRESLLLFLKYLESLMGSWGR